MAYQATAYRYLKAFRTCFGLTVCLSATGALHCRRLSDRKTGVHFRRFLPLECEMETAIFHAEEMRFGGLSFINYRSWFEGVYLFPEVSLARLATR